jgi:hypothetical protein
MKLEIRIHLPILPSKNQSTWRKRRVSIFERIRSTDDAQIFLSDIERKVGFPVLLSLLMWLVSMLEVVQFLEGKLFACFPEFPSLNGFLIHYAFSYDFLLPIVFLVSPPSFAESHPMTQTIKILFSFLDRLRLHPRCQEEVDRRPKDINSHFQSKRIGPRSPRIHVRGSFDWSTRGNPITLTCRFS